MREDRGGVEDRAVDQLQGPQVVLEPVAHQHRVGVDEPHQVVLDLLQVLGGTSLWIRLD